MSKTSRVSEKRDGEVESLFFSDHFFWWVVFANWPILFGVLFFGGLIKHRRGPNKYGLYVILITVRPSEGGRIPCPGSIRNQGGHRKNRKITKKDHRGEGRNHGKISIVLLRRKIADASHRQERWGVEKRGAPTLRDGNIVSLSKITEGGNKLAVDY